MEKATEPYFTLKKVKREEPYASRVKKEHTRLLELQLLVLDPECTVGQADGVSEIKEVTNNDARFKRLGGILDGLRPFGKLSNQSLRLRLIQELEIHLVPQMRLKSSGIRKPGRTFRSTGTSLFISFMEHRRA